jgi:hypothetical protein
MKTRMNSLALIAPLLVALSCNSSNNVEDPLIQNSTIPVSNLPRYFDESRLFQYKFSRVNPESLLTELWRAGIPVSQAWLPLDNRCMDPVGPRFTVELFANDGRMEKFDFLNGSGRLACATMLKRYVITR